MTSVRLKSARRVGPGAARNTASVGRRGGRLLSACGCSSRPGMDLALFRLFFSRYRSQGIRGRFLALAQFGQQVCASSPTDRLCKHPLLHNFKAMRGDPTAVLALPTVAPVLYSSSPAAPFRFPQPSAGGASFSYFRHLLVAQVHLGCRKMFCSGLISRQEFRVSIAARSRAAGDAFGMNDDPE